MRSLILLISRIAGKRLGRPRGLCGRACFLPRRAYNAASGSSKRVRRKAHSSAAGDCPRLAAKPCARQSLDPLLMMATTELHSVALNFSTFPLALQFRTTWGIGRTCACVVSKRLIIVEWTCEYSWREATGSAFLRATQQRARSLHFPCPCPQVSLP